MISRHISLQNLWVQDVQWIRSLSAEQTLDFQRQDLKQMNMTSSFEVEYLTFLTQNLSIVCICLMYSKKLNQSTTVGQGQPFSGISHVNGMVSQDNTHTLFTKIMQSTQHQLNNLTFFGVMGYMRSVLLFLGQYLPVYANSLVEEMMIRVLLV